tara:strand:+ start:19306 stop:19827 length:522 start_codon:yes stop_codon:yes gene_type:complete
MKLNKKKGILFWITGFSGSGKSEISYKLKNEIEKKFGKTIIISGDNFRQTFNFKNYDRNSRIKLGKQYINFLKLILDQNINIIFSIVGLYEEIRKFGKKNIQNYIEIFIDANIKKIERNSKKLHYKKKQKNILGLDLEPELPKKPDIKIINNFKTPISKISKKIIKEISKYEK